MSVEPTLPFLCVCGTQVLTSVGEGGSCAQCGRHYSTATAEPSLTWSFDGTPVNVDSEHPDEMIGQSLDHFRILNRLGHGGMGTVYRALDESLQRFVALKIIRHPTTTDDDSSEAQRVNRLLQEARAQSRINHANVVHVYFVSRDPTVPYLAMELVPGETLAQRLQQGTMPFGSIVSIGIQIALALGESARLDVTHGDIKPSNILLHGDHVKLSDFGLAQRRSQRQDEVKIAGTPSYMAPEVCRGEPLSAQADMYALGVTLFEMTFGRLPYSTSDRSLATRFLMHQEAAVEFPSAWPTSLPDDWRQLLARLLEKSPERRFPNWHAVVTELRRLQPVALVPAGRVQRAVAWAMDFLVLQMSSALIWFGIERLFRTRSIPSSVQIPAEMASSLLPPALLALWIVFGHSTPGKSLMQLRVLDLHGFVPRRSLLFWRSVLQYLPAWLMPLAMLDLWSSRAGWIAGTIIIAGWLFLLIDLVFAVFRKSRRTFHDQLCATQVALIHAEE